MLSTTLFTIKESDEIVDFLLKSYPKEHSRLQDQIR